MNKPKDEVGNKYGRLLVIRRATEEEYPRKAGKPAIWLCKCDCGNTTFAAGTELRNGKRTSCGCLSREKATNLAKQLGEKNRKDLLDRRFGRLTVVKLVKVNPATWLCKCDCGAYAQVSSSNLLSGHTTSCGCNRYFGDKHSSKGEDKITSILKKSNLYFEREKTFPNLKGHSGKPLRFDFAVYNQKKELIFLIEFHGLQHYQKVDFFQKNRQDFLKRQEYDRKKISYCLANNITLYTIPYFELDNLNSLEDLTQKKFRVFSKWHNDVIRRKLFES